ncbi:MAG: response regulator, partial [Ignavibacteriales bacterium]|nr:response regulator [Ignavibacteriales bacterium]
MKDTILLIDDEPEYRKLLAKLIRLEGFNVIEADNGKSGLEVLHYEDISVVVTDVRLPDVSGLQLLGRIKTISPNCEVLVVTAFGRIE